MMSKNVKIRTLKSPGPELSDFDPGAYLASLDFYETEDVVTEEDRDGLAQFIHLLAFIALKFRSNNWSASSLPHGSSAYLAVQSHFEHLDGWNQIYTEGQGIVYRDLATFLMNHFPPKPPGS